MFGWVLALASLQEIQVVQRALDVEPYLGETVRIEIEAEIPLALFDGGLEPLFHRPVDLPIQLVPGGADGPVEERESPVESGARSLVVGEEVRRARVSRRGEVALVTLVRSLVPLTPGPLELDPPVLRFRPRVVGGLDALGRPVTDPGELREVRGLALRLEVRDIPEPDPGSGWTGFVGAVALEAREVPRRAVVGEPFRLRFALSGDEQPFDTRAPEYAVPEPFSLLGALSERGEDGSWLLRYDCVAQSAGEFELPAFTFAAFEPESGEHRVQELGPFPLFVAPAVRPEPAPESKGERPGSRRWLLPAAAGGLVLLLLAGAAGLARRR